MPDKDVRRISAGEVFGRWTILGETEYTARKERKWFCRCQCGTERYVLERSLLYGGSVSCGCLRKERSAQVNSPDLTGQQFGELTVIRKLENSGTGASRWLCRCACGGEYITSGSLLTTGKRTRCSGRNHRRNYAHADISRKRFGSLVALHPVEGEEKTGSVIWHCRCDCGNEVDVSYNRLVYTNQKSCGCRKKEHEEKLHTHLTHAAGTSIDMLRSKKLPSDNTTGYKGVYRIRGKYAAKIVFQKKQYFLGTYDTIEEAAEARKEAEEVLFDGVAEHYRRWKEIADADARWAAQNPLRILVQQTDKRLRVTLLPDLHQYAGEKERACEELPAIRGHAKNKPDSDYRKQPTVISVL